MKSGILLDVDGTLWNAAASVTESWNAYRHAHIPEMPGSFTEHELSAVFGKTMDEIGEILLKDLSPDRRRQCLDGMMDFEVEYLKSHGGVVYPEVADTLASLSRMGYHLYIVSNCQKGYIEDFLHTSGTEDLIDDHICFGDTLKPKSESIRLCVERNSLDWAVYVGDTQGDLDAVIGAQLPCSDAKVPFIFARYGFGSIDESAADLPAIDSLSQLPDLMEAYC